MIKIEPPKIVTRIDMLLAAQKRTREQLAEAIGRNKQIFTDWRIKCNMPKIDDIYNISQILGVRMEYLMFGEVRENEDETVLASMYHSIPDEYKGIVFATVKAQVSYIRDNESDIL